MTTNTTTIALTFPVTCPHRGELREVSLRRAKVRDILAAQDGGGGPGRIEVRLFALLTGLSMDVIETMDEVDYLAIQDVYAGFRRGSANPAVPTSAAPSSASAG